MFSNYRTFSWNKGQHCIVAMLLGLCFFVAPAGAQTYTYKKSLGKSGKKITSPYGYEMQFAHEDRNVIYCKAGTITLYRNGEAFFTYARWYNYKTDGEMLGLTCSDAKHNTSNGGLIWYPDSWQKNKANAKFNYNGRDTVYIACDQSSYKDGVVRGTKEGDTVIYEPTIEQRMIFEIRPASEMAEKIGINAKTKWLEEYDIMAPTNQTIHIGPKYAFMNDNTKTYPSYFYDDGNDIVAMGNSSFVATSNNKFTEGNWTWRNSSTEIDTVYVCKESYNVIKSETSNWTLNADKFSSEQGTIKNNPITINSNDTTLSWEYNRAKYQNTWLPQLLTSPQPATINNNENNNEPCVQFGKGPILDVGGGVKLISYTENLDLTTTIPTGVKVDSVYIKCASNVDQGYTLQVSIGSQTIGTKDLSTTLTQYGFNVGNDGSGPVQLKISFNAKNRKNFFYVQSIDIVYQKDSITSIGTITSVEPSPEVVQHWKKIETITQTGDRRKTDNLESTSLGWIWMEDTVQVTSPSVSSGQYIEVNPVSQPTKKTYKLLYSTDVTQTDITYDQTGVTSITKNTYTYNSDNSSWELFDTSLKDSIIGNETTTTTPNSGGGQIFHIAQFRVQFFDKNVVGPRAAEMNSFINNMELIAEQNFNFGYSSQNPLPTNTTQRFIPLPVEESTFGFYYGKADRVSGDREKCFYNEYSFVSNGYGYMTNDSLANHVGQGLATDATTGFALYADGSQKAGTVFTLDFGAEFCPGAKMFFTAWIGDQNTDSYTGGHPIFTFYVEGIDAEGNAHTLATFTTGEFKKDKNNWHHIIFPLEFSENVDYERFKLRIVNMAATVTKNDFFIDDVRVYLQRAKISPVQASLSNHASCLNEREDLVLYTRVDYGELKLEHTSTETRSFYYRWYDAEGNPIHDTACHYKGHALDSHSIPYGIVTVRADQNDLLLQPYAADTMASFSAFDNAFYNLNLQNNDTAVVRYVRETCVNQDWSTSERFVAYIATPVKAQLGKTYRCVVTYALSSLPERDSGIDQTELCSSRDFVRVVNGLCIRCKELGGLVPGGSQAQANANNAYELTLVSETMQNNNSTLNRQVDCYFGYWLFGREIMDGEYDADRKRQELEALYGDTYENVKDAIQAYIANPDEADADQQKIVKRLSTIGALKLSNSSIMADTSFLVLPLYNSDTISFTAFPFCDLTGSKEYFCHEPISISLYFPKTGGTGEGGQSAFKRNSFYFVKNQDEDVPEFLPNLHPRQVRIPKDSVQQYVPIRLTDTTSTYVLKTAQLYSTNNTALPAKVAQKWNWMDITNPNITGEKPHKVRFMDLDSLPEGYKYTFGVAYDVKDKVQKQIQGQIQERDTTYEGEAFITFIVVPDVVYYAGSKGDVWNDDEKWQFKKQDGKTAAAFVPLPSTKVVFQNDYVVLPPVVLTPSLQPGLQAQDVEADALPYITYDINYVPYSCSNVYIARGVSLLGQQRLTTINTNGESEPTKWTLELPVLTQKWKMNAIPLQSVVLGDMFVPAAGESTTDLFAVSAISQNAGEYASDRVTHKFYNSLYNKDAKQYLGKGEYESIKNSTWTFATNILKEPVTPGYGWALGYDGDIANFSIRLPKVDDMYRYFNRYAGEKWTQEEEYPDRTNAGKAMFTPGNDGKMLIELENEFSSEIFLFGNPTFAYIDLLKLKESFNTENSANSISIEGFYKAGVSANSRYQLAAALPTDAASDWLSSVNKSLLTANDKLGLLAPTEAVFIKLNTSCTTIRFNIALSMLCDKGDNDKKYYGDDTPTPLSAPASYTTDDNVADDYANADASAIFISASLGNYESSTSIYDHPEAEVELFMLDKAKTPFAIYTVGNNKALAINHLRDGQTRIPLVMFAEDPVERPLFTFSGAPRYIVEWDLVDIVSGVRQPLYDSLTIHLNIPQDGNVRYYLERSRHGIYTSESKTDAFQTYAFGGMLTIYSSDTLYDLCVYDPAGRLLYQSADAGTSCTVNLTAGTYIVRASGSTLKVIVP